MGQTTGFKNDSEKPRMDLLDGYALTETAKVLTHGAKKYDDFNWRKGLKYRRLLAATLRHLFAFQQGEDLDEETGLSHLAHALCEIMFLLWMTKFRPDQDDRWKEKQTESLPIDHSPYDPRFDGNSFPSSSQESPYGRIIGQYHPPEIHLDYNKKASEIPTGLPCK